MTPRKVPTFPDLFREQAEIIDALKERGVNGQVLRSVVRSLAGALSPKVFRDPDSDPLVVDVHTHFHDVAKIAAARYNGELPGRVARALSVATKPEDRAIVRRNMNGLVAVEAAINNKVAETYEPPYLGPAVMPSSRIELLLKWQMDSRALASSEFGNDLPFEAIRLEKAVGRQLAETLSSRAAAVSKSGQLAASGLSLGMLA